MYVDAHCGRTVTAQTSGVQHSALRACTRTSCTRPARGPSCSLHARVLAQRLRRASGAVTASAASVEREAALPDVSVQRTDGAANDIVEFKSDRSHETDVVIVGGGLGGEAF